MGSANKTVLRHNLMVERNKLRYMLQSKWIMKLYSNIDFNKLSLKLEAVETILQNDEMFEDIYNIEVINSICFACYYLKNHVEDLFYEDYKKETKTPGLKVFPFGIFNELLIKKQVLRECSYDSENLRKYLCDLYKIKYYSYDELVEAKRTGIKDLEYQSGVIIDDNNETHYRLVTYPYLNDFSYILNDNYIPKSIEKKKIYRK